MEPAINFFIPDDIPVVCVTAHSFPQGILAAHGQLRQLFPPGDNRQYFGISWADQNGAIIYKAAATVIAPGEAGEYSDRFLIRKGMYSSIFIQNLMQQPQKIKQAFDQLLQHPHLDPTGYCLEIYEGHNDVRCLVGLDASQQ